MNADQLKEALYEYTDYLDVTTNLVVRAPSGLEMELKRLVMEIPSDGQNQLVLEVVAK